MRHFLLHINIHFYIPRRAVLPVPGRRTAESEKPHAGHACSGSCSCHSRHSHTDDESGCQCHCQETGHECRCRHEKEKR